MKTVERANRRERVWPGWRSLLRAGWASMASSKRQHQQQPTVQRPLPRTGAPLWALLDWIHPGAELHLEGRVSMATCGWRAVSCKIGGCRWRLCSHSRIAGQHGRDARHQKAAICCRRAICTGPVVLMTQLDDCSTLLATLRTRVDDHGNGVDERWPCPCWRAERQIGWPCECE